MRLALSALALLLGCQSAAPARPGAAPTAPPPSQPAPPNGAQSGTCCVPAGAYDPADHAYQDCVGAGGKPWGSDGCGRRADGSVEPAPPAAAP